MSDRMTRLTGAALALILSSCAMEPAPVSNVVVETLVDGVPLHGIQGLTWANDGFLYAAAMSAQKVSRIDPVTGAVEIIAEAPFGESDDVAIGPDGTLVWTAMVAGELRAKRPDGSVDVLARDARGLNPVAFSPDGRLFAVVMGTKSRLYEYDINKDKAPRLISDEIKLLNGFEVGPDGYLYGPFWRSGELVKIDVETGEQTLLASGLGEPAAVALDSQGQIISVDYHTGHVKRTNPDTGVWDTLAKLDPPLDNLAIGPDDTIYVSDTARSGIYVLSPDGELKGRLLGGDFSTPGGLAITCQNDREVLVVADSTGYRFVDVETGEVTRPKFKSEYGTSLNLSISGSIMALSDPRMGRVHVMDLTEQKLMYDKFGLDVPYGVAVLPNGDVIIAEYGAGTVSLWDGENTTLIAEDLEGPVGLAVESSDTVLVAEHTSGSIVRLSLRTGFKETVFEGLNKPEGLAIMSDNRIAVAEVGAGTLVAVDLGNGAKDVLATDLEFGIAAVRAPHEVGVPTGVAVGGDGAIYVTEDRRNAITKITIQ